ncbi:MAG: hypothetical protein CSB47_05870 [Proteobacteria bacterium]|nr:MAG: hypothetical protein CSB47_05870 [Pseudomonadota bacterium]
MKRVIYLSCLLGACNTPAPDGSALTPTPKSARYDYQIIGGKPGAQVEQLQIDCINKQAVLSRQTPEKVAVYRHVAAVSAEQCLALAGLAAPLCRESGQQQTDVFDAAGYTLRCHGGNLPSVSFHWQGTLRSAPDGLRPWHDYTRGLIGSAFPGVNAYP